jgi:hypothetical protein
MAQTIDELDVACSFESRRCTDYMIGAGGLQLHHEFPEHLGGEPQGRRLVLCPNHHVRQHSLIRYLIECQQQGVSSDYDVIRHFTADEVVSAQYARDRWLESGRKPVNWNVPAARDA